jgi:RHS repeat-associated protein
VLCQSGDTTIPPPAPQPPTSSSRPSQGGTGGERSGGQTSQGPAFQLAPSISLPKGGGAVKGIDEKHGVSAATGSASASVSFALPQGRNGFGPALGLSYDSGAGNGLFGLGWSMGLPSISRRTARGLPRYGADGTEDTFVLAGAEDLVPKHDSSGALLDRPEGNFDVRTFWPRVEGAFSRIERWTRRDTGEAHWRILTRDNILHYLGRTVGTRIADPADAGRVFEWLLDESIDDRGNSVRYGWVREDDVDVDAAAAHEAHRAGRPYANRYLKRVTWANRTLFLRSFIADAAIAAWANLPPEEVPPVARDSGERGEGDDWLDALDPAFEVVFDYGDHPASTPTAVAGSWARRADPVTDHRAGFERRTLRRCQRVLVFHRFPSLGLGATLVRETRLEYDARQAVSLLRRVVHVGHRVAVAPTFDSTLPFAPDTSPTIELPAVTYTYTEPIHDPTVNDVPPESLRDLPGGWDTASTQWVDLDGDGLPGLLLQQHGAWWYKPNLGPTRALPTERPGPARFGPLQPVPTLPTLAAARPGGAQLLDLDGDQALHLTFLEPALSGYHTRVEGDWKGFKTFQQLPNIDWSDPNLRWIDLTGDGRPDLLVTGDDALWWYPSKGLHGFGAAKRMLNPNDERDGPRVVFADGTQTMFLADMTGDGLADLVRIRNGDVCYWPNLGWGRFGPRVRMSDAPRFVPTDDQFDPQRVRLVDLDGTGPSDLAYVGADAIQLHHNLSGDRWEPGTHLPPLPATMDVGAVTFVDLLGCGTPCLVWASNLPGDLGAPLRYIDLHASTKPFLLKEAHNGIGGRTTWAWAPSTAWCIADRDAGLPWVTRLPFPVHLVAGTVTDEEPVHLVAGTVTDEEPELVITGTTLRTFYAYRDGHYDPVEREFRGFARVDQRDAETFTDGNDQPPVLTRTWFHTGASANRENIEARLSEQFYPDVPPRSPLRGDLGPAWAPGEQPGNLTPWRLAAEPFPTTWSTRQTVEALRALRGRPLRVEVYGLTTDETAAEDADSVHPYSISQSTFLLREHQAPGESPEEHGVYQVLDAETLELHLERVPTDPRISHSLVLAHDAFGAPVRVVAIAYPRSPDKVEIPEQRWTAASHSTTELRDLTGTDGALRIGLPIGATTEELRGLVTNGAPVTREAMLDWIDRQARVVPHTEDLEAWSATADHRDPFTEPTRRVVQSVRTHYVDALDPERALPFGQVDALALAGETHTCAFTRRLLELAYGRDWQTRAIVDPFGVGGRLRGMEAALVAEGAYHYEQGTSPAQDTWWASSGRATYDPRRFWLPVGAVDPFGARYHTTWDHPHYLATIQVVDPLGTTVRTEIDYHGPAPYRMTDANLDESEVLFDAAGRVVASVLRGFDGAGDTLASPTSLVQYDTTSRPVSARVAERHQHGPSNPRWRTQVVYADGLGRELMTAASNWPRTGDEAFVCSGRVVLNNKGNPVQQFEPYFAPHDGYDREVGPVGVSSTITYDAPGRPVRTRFPDLTFAETRFSPWGQEDHDAGDTVARSEWSDHQSGRPATASFVYADTPTVTRLDVLGRPVEVITQNRPAVGDPISRHTTLTLLDIEGNPWRIRDARGNRVMDTIFAVGNTRLTWDSMDGGARWELPNALGQPWYAWTELGARFRSEYDVLRRPTRLHIQPAGGAERLAEHQVYGESLPDGIARAGRLYGRLVRHYDASGIIDFVEYGLHGQALRSERRVCEALEEEPRWRPADPVVWPALGADAARLLEDVFVGESEFDALGRLMHGWEPDGSTATARRDARGASRLDYQFGDLGQLLSLELHKGAERWPLILGTKHNARGQRTWIKLGAGIGRLTDPSVDPQTLASAEIHSEYDPTTFRLIDLHNRRTTGQNIQHARYVYDVVGNILDIEQTGVPAPGHNFEDGSLHYRYDALSRLVWAEGREHPAFAARPSAAHLAFIGDEPQPGDLQRLRRYTESYVYDEVGNILEMLHLAGGEGWRRRYQYMEDSNRLVGTTLRTVSDLPTVPYVASAEDGRYEQQTPFDVHGNILGFSHLRPPTEHEPALTWDERDRLRRSRNPNGEDTFYIYDASGQRIQKLTRHANANGAVKDRRIYVGSFEVYREPGGTNGALERQSLSVFDGSERVVLFERRTVGGTVAEREPVARYQLGDHLGSVMFELDEAGVVITWEEFTPYGATAFEWRNSRLSQKRYRYTGMERDEETGLQYHAARYYAAWLGRWCGVDPELCVSEASFCYASDNCIRLRDGDGRQPRMPQDGEKPASEVLNALEIVEAMGVETLFIEEVLANGTRVVVDSTMDEEYMAMYSATGGSHTGLDENTIYLRPEQWFALNHPYAESGMLHAEFLNAVQSLFHESVHAWLHTIDPDRPLDPSVWESAERAVAGTNVSLQSNSSIVAREWDARRLSNEALAEYVDAAVARYIAFVDLDRTLGMAGSDPAIMSGPDGPVNESFGYITGSDRSELYRPTAPLAESIRLDADREFLGPEVPAVLTPPPPRRQVGNRVPASARQGYAQFWARDVRRLTPFQYQNSPRSVTPPLAMRRRYATP